MTKICESVHFYEFGGLCRLTKCQLFFMCFWLQHFHFALLLRFLLVREFVSTKSGASLMQYILARYQAFCSLLTGRSYSESSSFSEHKQAAVVACGYAEVDLYPDINSLRPWKYHGSFRIYMVSRNNFQKQSTVFLVKGVLKISSKVTGEHPCRSLISIKLLCNFIEITLRRGVLL